MKLIHLTLKHVPSSQYLLCGDTPTFQDKDVRIVLLVFPEASR